MKKQTDRSPQENITSILNDLYTIDPGFKQYNKELRVLIRRVLAVKPDTTIDTAFAARLRTELVGVRSEYFDIKALQPNKSPFKHLSYLNIYSGVAGAALALIIILPVAFFTTSRSLDVQVKNDAENGQIDLKDITSSLPLKPQISDKGKNAFGKIASIAPAVAAPQVTAQSYVYKGGTLPLSENAGTVYKRTRKIALGQGIILALQNANLGLANLSSFNFADASFHTIDLAESKSDGYSMSINFDDGLIAIAQKGIKKTALIASSTVNEETLAFIAEEFLRNHGIDRSIYGQPTVSPESPRTVVYPLLLGGKEVFDSHGEVYGLKVTIDTDNQKVALIDNLTFQQYEGSSYSLETDPNNITALITPSPTSSSSPTLGTPTSVLMRYTTTDSNGVVDELFVPALLFPVSSSTTPVVSKNVIIPLAKINPTSDN